MPIRDVPPEQWPEFLESFTRQHRAWLATLEPPEGAPLEARPLAGVVPRGEGSRVAAIEVSFGAGSGTQPVRVENPIAVRVGQTDDGADCSLEIIAEGGTCTRLRFRTAVRPEMLNGVAPGEV